MSSQAGSSSRATPGKTAASVTTSTSSPNPRNRPIDLSPLKELLKENLLDALLAVQGGKTLVLDQDLAGSLGLVVDVGSLKNQAVEKMFWLEKGPLQAPTRNIIYLCKSSRRNLEIIASQIKTHQAEPTGAPPHAYHLLLAPRSTSLALQTLTDLGIAGDVQVKEIGLGSSWVVLEEDVLSLEKGPGVVRDLYLEGDDSPLYDASLALMTFQRAYGLFPRILGKGDAAKRLSSLLQRQRASRPDVYASLQTSHQVDALIIIDRSTDWVTPMMTMLTYGGLLDEFLGMKNSHIEIDPSLLSTEPARPGTTSTNPLSPGLTPTPSVPKKRKHLLSRTTDPLYSELVDSNFSIVGAQLARLAKRLEADYQGKNSLDTVGKMKEFVGKLGGLQGEQRGLKLHTGLTEILMPITNSEEFGKVLEIQQNIITGYEPTNQMLAIEDLLSEASQTPWTILRLIVLLSLTIGGIRQKTLDAFKREFLQVYGYHHLSLFIHLEKVGLLCNAPGPGRNVFPTTRKNFRLWVDEVDERDPNDIAFTYSGYSPLSIRLVQCVTMKPAVLASAVAGPDRSGGSKSRQTIGGEEEGKKAVPLAHGISGWKGFEDVLNGLPGVVVDETQRAEGDGKNGGASPTDHDGSMKNTLVFFLGGCTQTEISALRWMNGQAKGRKYIVATTHILNGSTLLQELGVPEPMERRTSI